MNVVLSIAAADATPGSLTDCPSSVPFDGSALGANFSSFFALFILSAAHFAKKSAQWQT
jgi:hypothetical protein